MSGSIGFFYGVGISTFGDVGVYYIALALLLCVIGVIVWKVRKRLYADPR